MKRAQIEWIYGVEKPAYHMMGISIGNFILCFGKFIPTVSSFKTEEKEFVQTELDRNDFTFQA